MNAAVEKYRGSEKHKNRPSRGAKGTLCPEWTHSNPERYNHDPFKHDWEKTKAHALFKEAVAHPTGGDKRYATMNDIAFEAKPSNDGAWHGYPIPWDSVPNAVLDYWLEKKIVTNKSFKKHKSYPLANIHWALESDNQ